MNTPLRIAVVGAGSMGRHHAIAIQRLDGRARLVAVADPNERAARAVAESLKIPSWYSSEAMMLAAEAPDVVHVCTPPALHAEGAMAALAAGAHAYVEKPFTESLRDAEAVLDAAAVARRQVCAGHQLLMSKPTLEANDLLAAVGRIHHVESYFAFKPARPMDGRTPRTAVEQLLDILPHPVYLLLHFMGQGAPLGEMRVHGLTTDDRGDAFATIAVRDVVGVLTVTLRGRPADSWVRIVGTRGTLHLDYIRDLVLPSLGAGSAIEKILDPYARAARLTFGTAANLVRRVVRRERSYPALAQMFEAFYRHATEGTQSPVTQDNLLCTVELCERVATALRERARGSDVAELPRATVAVTGGTGLLGRSVVTALLRQHVTPVVLARRIPPPSERIAGVAYRQADLGGPTPVQIPDGVEVVVHCAAETVGGWDAHQRNSIGATQALLDGMRASGVRKLVYVSSLAVIDADAPQPLTEQSALEREGRRRGPYVWGKLEAERIATNAKSTHGIAVRIARPGALVSREAFDPPGKLGRAIGGTYVAVGRKSSTIPICDLEMAGRMLAGMAQRFEDAPSVLHLVDAAPASRRELVERVRATRPGVRVIWINAPALAVLSGLATLLQKAMHPTRPAVSVWSAFAAPRCDSSQLQCAWVLSSPTPEMSAGGQAPLR